MIRTKKFGEVELRYDPEADALTIIFPEWSECEPVGEVGGHIPDITFDLVRDEESKVHVRSVEVFDASEFVANLLFLVHPELERELGRELADLLKSLLRGVRDGG